MAVVQSSYADTPPIGFPGMIASGETANRISRTVEDAGGVAFGKAVFRGLGDHGCTATPTAGAFLGFVATDAAGSADVVPQYATAAVLTKGALFVVAGEAVTDGAAVYVTAAGAIVDTATDNVAAPGWLFDATAASGAVVRIANRG